MNYYLQAWKKFAVFNGRARRKEYWFFALFNALIFFVLGIVDGLTGGNPDADSGIAVLGGIFILAGVIPGISVTVRRLHDTDRTGWWCLIAFIPIVGHLVLFVFTLQDSTPGSNRFGASPKVSGLLYRPQSMADWRKLLGLPPSGPEMPPN